MVLGISLLPTEEFAVEGDLLIQIGCKQLVPADPAELAGIRGFLWRRQQAIDHRKRCSMGIGYNRNPADIGIGGRYVHRAAKALDPISSYVRIPDADVPHPSRPRAHLAACFR